MQQSARDKVPHLPGMFYTPLKGDFHKKKGCSYHVGQRVTRDEGVTYDFPMVKTPRLPPTAQGSLTTTMRSSYTCELPPHEIVPACRAYDRHVLRFLMQTKDDNTDVFNRQENAVTRDMLILYYLEDDTLQIISPPADNSGFGIFAQHSERAHATFLRRHRVPHRDGGYFRPQNLEIGRVIEVYGRSFLIQACDTFTRYWYDAKGTPQPEDKTVFEQPVRRRPRTVETCRPSGDMSARSGNMSARSGNMSARSGAGGRGDKMRRYMQNYNKICRFHASFDDMTTPQFERRFFTIFYYLEDDTIKVRENFCANSGRGPCPVFYQKARVAKNPVGIPGVFATSRAEYYGIEDFAIGSTIIISNFKFFIYDCDSYTREYFQKNLHELDPPIDMQIPVKDDTEKGPQDVTNEEVNDGFNTGIAFNWDEAKPSRMQVGKEQGLLRFRAKWAVEEGEQHRRFILTYCTVNNTVSIHEEHLGLGEKSGKFLERAKRQNQLTGAPLKPADLHPGNEVMLMSRRYTILEMDDHTKAYFDNGGVQALEKIDLANVLRKVGEKLKSGSIYLRDMYRKLDVNKHSVLSKVDFEQELRRIGYDLTEEEILSVMLYYDKKLDGQITYEKFCQVFVQPSPYGDEEEKEVQAQQGHNREEYGQLLRGQDAQCAEADATRKAFQRVTAVFHIRPHLENRLMVEFNHMRRNVHSSVAKIVDAKQIQEAFRRCGYELDLSDIERTYRHLNPENKPMEYTSFMRLLKVTFHDFAANR